MLKPILMASSIGALFLLPVFPALAQTSPSSQGNLSQVASDTVTRIEISNEEVQQFAYALRQMRQIQDDTRSRANQVLDTAGLSIARFDEILQTQRHSSNRSEITSDEQQRFDQAFAEISRIRSETEQQIQQAIETQGLAVARFNQIFAAVQQNPELRQAVERALRRLNDTELG